jgi:SAM-dependent methyltransferase
MAGFVNSNTCRRLEMLQYDQTLFVGAPRGAGLRKTVDLITGKLRRLGDFRGDRLLDVGCGDGAFTRILGAGFREVHGIDVQETYLERFRDGVKDDNRYAIANMSASAMTFPDAHFDTIVTIETLEHVPDLAGAAREICRVLRPGGELLITVPNRWFPFENHGMRIGSWERQGRIPLLPYLPMLHRRFSLARVFKVRDLDLLFVTGGLQRAAVDYAWPTFEHGGNRLQPLLRPLFGLMRTLERSPVRMFGSSVIVRYVKE